MRAREVDSGNGPVTQGLLSLRDTDNLGQVIRATREIVVDVAPMTAANFSAPFTLGAAENLGSESH